MMPRSFATPLRVKGQICQDWRRTVVFFRRCRVVSRVGFFLAVRAGVRRKEDKWRSQAGVLLLVQTGVFCPVTKGRAAGYQTTVLVLCLKARAPHGALAPAPTPKTRTAANRRRGVFVGCLTSQQQASVSQGRICSDSYTCCHTEIETADQTFYLTQSQYTDTGPTSPSADLITPGA